MNRFIVLLLSVLPLVSCNSTLTQDECQTNYAQKGGTDQIVRWGYQLCAIATDKASSSQERDDALCAIKKIPSTPSELAFKQVIAQCRTQ